MRCDDVSLNLNALIKGYSNIFLTYGPNHLYMRNATKRITVIYRHSRNRLNQNKLRISFLAPLPVSAKSSVDNLGDFGFQIFFSIPSYSRC